MEKVEERQMTPKRAAQTVRLHGIEAAEHAERLAWVLAQPEPAPELEGQRQEHTLASAADELA